MPSERKPKLLVVSHVLPFPGSSGQQQRVRYTLEAAARSFHVTFATSATVRQRESVTRGLEGLCDELVLLPSRYNANPLSLVWHRGAGTAYTIATGLKRSNYVIGKLELEPARLLAAVDGGGFDCALFEYWHASAAAEALRRRGIPCVLDMHNILWQSYDMQVGAKPGPAWIKELMVNRYRSREEEAWRCFDAVVAINDEELRYVRRALGDDVATFYAPMGIDAAKWPYSWTPAAPPRVGFYGALASAHNQRHAEMCAVEVMPRIWERHPKAELWVVGSKPPARIRALAADPRIRVTGFVEEVRTVLETMSVVVCPWVGRYGFRSRLVELMALGVPVVASPDAIAGMDMGDGEELLLGADAVELASGALRVIEDEGLANDLSARGRRKVESQYNNQQTYGRLVRELESWLHTRAGAARTRTVTA